MLIMVFSCRSSRNQIVSNAVSPAAVLETKGLIMLFSCCSSRNEIRFRAARLCPYQRGCIFTAILSPKSATPFPATRSVHSSITQTPTPQAANRMRRHTGIQTKLLSIIYGKLGFTHAAKYRFERRAVGTERNTLRCDVEGTQYPRTK